MSVKRVTLMINGAERSFICDPEHDSLADVLRRLGLTGTKIGCDKGLCGACSVILDGQVVRSCIKKMKNIKDFQQVITIEGLGTAEHLHPLQQAWITFGGVQCGFCTPGFIVSAKALLDENPNPSREEVRAWFQKHKNACRCTGYKQLVDAVIAAAAVMRGQVPYDTLRYQPREDGKIYNTRYPRPIALAKVLGTCDFGDDIAQKAPDMLELAVVQPPISHARILSVNTAAAEAMPGVVKVITYKDIKGANRIFFPVTDAHTEAMGFERPILVEDKVFRRGDVIAMVAADTRRHARAAAQAVQVEYEPLPEYMNCLDAIADDAVEIHEGQPNLYLEMPIHKGVDTREIIPGSAHQVSGSFYSTRQPHLPIEPDVQQAYIDDDGVMVIQCKALFLGMVPPLVAGGIGFPPEKIRMIENPTGASFGYTMSPCHPALVAAATLALEGRLVNLTMSYEEFMHFSGKRAPSYTNATLACDAKGKLTALEFESLYDKGAYTEVAMIIEKMNRFIGAPYYIPNIMGLSKAATSNHTFTTAYRGYGSPQAYTVSEQLMDMLAEKIGMDPLEFRYINVYRPGDTSNDGHTFSVYPMGELIKRIRPVYQAALERAKGESTPEKLRGVGVSCGHYNCSPMPNDHAEIDLELNPDGSVTHYNSWEDQGQGADVGTLAHTHQALRPLGLKPEQIHLVMNDLGTCPITGPAGGSRSHYMAGNATIDAAAKLMDAMRKPDGTFRTYQEMVAEGIATKYRGVHDTGDYTTELDSNTFQGDPSAEYTYAVYVAEVEVEAASGKTKVLGMHCVSDVGIIGNYNSVDGQAYGGMSHCIGFALTEDYSDVKKHTNMAACGIPYILDVPDGEHFTSAYVETPRPRGPFGSSGCSEVYQSGDHVAIINAIYNATGVRAYTLPATPEKVKAGMAALARGETIKQEKYYLGGDLYERLEYWLENPV